MKSFLAVKDKFFKEMILYVLRTVFYNCLGDSNLCKCQRLKFVKSLNKGQ